VGRREGEDLSFGQPLRGVIPRRVGSLIRGSVEDDIWTRRVSNRDDRARIHEARHTPVPARLQYVAEAADDAGMGVWLPVSRRGEVIYLVAAFDGRGERGRLGEAAANDIQVDALATPEVARRPDERAHAVSLILQHADQMCPEMTARADDESLHGRRAIAARSLAT
jgi:hypothetical protein